MLLCDVSLALHFKMLFCFMCSFLFFSCKYSFFISSLDFSNNIERFSCIIKRSKLIIFSMLIDNQLWRARVGIYNSNHLHHFTCLKINPANLDIYIILKFSNFYMITVYLILLTYIYQFICFWRSYIIMVSILTQSILLMFCFLNILIFAAMPLIWNVCYYLNQVILKLIRVLGNLF